MSKKGFTLVELIGVIVILALLALLITPTVNKLLKEQKQKVYDAQMKIVLNAAKNYVADKQDTLDISDSGLALSVSDLYNNGYLNKDKVINPSTNKEFKNCVLVKWDDSYNQYNYKYVDCTTLADIDINASDDDPEYTVLSYLQSTGTQYIDTGFKANNNTSVETQVMFSENKTASIYSSRTGLNSSSYSLFTIGGLPTRFDYSNTTYSSSYTPTLNTKVKLYANKNLYYVDDTLMATATEATFTSTGNMFIFVSYTSGANPTSLTNYAKIKMYYFKVWDNGTLVRDMIPVKDKSGVACFYDKVNSQYYYNAGTGTFTTE